MASHRARRSKNSRLKVLQGVGRGILDKISEPTNLDGASDYLVTLLFETGLVQESTGMGAVVSLD
jgi:hypothetical protein